MRFSVKILLLWLSVIAYSWNRLQIPHAQIQYFQKRILTTITAPLEKVFYAVSTEKGFKGWWVQDREAQGDIFISSFSNKQHVAKFKVVKNQENKLIRMDAFEAMTEQWAESYLLFELEENDGNTVLTFTHGNWKEQNQEFAMCNTNWGKLMLHLKSFAESGSPNPMM